MKGISVAICFVVGTWILASLFFLPPTQDWLQSEYGGNFLPYWADDVWGKYLDSLGLILIQSLALAFFVILFRKQKG